MDTVPGWGIACLSLTLMFLQSSSSIEGTVHVVGTNEPVRGAIVSLDCGLAGGPNRRPISVDSDEKGRFVLKGLTPGSYCLKVAKNGYVTTFYGAHSFFDRGTILQLIAAQAKTDIVLQLTPTGALNGVVSDSDSNPIPNTTVQVLRAAITDLGEQTLRSVGNARTDDRGSFRLYSLPPGRYYVLAGGPQLNIPFENGGVGTSPNEIESNGVPLTFYPDVQDLPLATLVTIASGTESTVRLVVRPKLLPAVTGRLLDSRTKEVVRNARLSLLINLGMPLQLPSSSVTQNEVGFRFVDIQPGKYRAVAFLGTRRIFWGDVTVNDENFDNLVLMTTEPLSVNGHLKIDGSPPLDVGVQLLPSVNGLIVSSAPTPNIANITDGRFTVENVMPGEYRVRVLSYSPGHYVRSVSAGGTDVLNKPLQVGSSGPGDLEVTMSSRVAAIDGVVLDQRQQPVASAKIVLVPELGRDRFDLYRQVSANAEGRFIFNSVAPGTYTMFAASSFEPYSYFDNGFVRSLAGRSTLVRVGESTTTTVTLPLISTLSR